MRISWLLYGHLGQYFIKSIKYLGPIKAGSVLALAPLSFAITVLGEWPDKASIIGLVGLLIAVIRLWNLNKSKLLSSRE